MSADSSHIDSYGWARARPVFRYAVGAAVILTFSLVADYTLSYLTPVLALNFLNPGMKPQTFKTGIAFLIMLAVTSFFAVIFSRIFISFPMVFLPMFALVLLLVLYSKRLNAIVKLFLTLSLTLIPFVSLVSTRLGSVIAINLIINALVALLLVWLVFLIFPFNEKAIHSTKAGQVRSEQERYRDAINTVIVVMPLFILYFIYQWSGAILVLIFVMILSLTPATRNAKAGIFMVIANIAGGIGAIIVFNLLTVVPNVFFLFLLTIIAGLLMGSRLFSGRPGASLYGTAFSTFLLILGSVTGSEGEAGDKVWTRVLQMSMAVSYVVIAFTVIRQFSRSKKELNT